MFSPQLACIHHCWASLHRSSWAGHPWMQYILHKIRFLWWIFFYVQHSLLCSCSVVWHVQGVVLHWKANLVMNISKCDGMRRHVIKVVIILGHFYVFVLSSIRSSLNCSYWSCSSLTTEIWFAVPSDSLLISFAFLSPLIGLLTVQPNIVLTSSTLLTTSGFDITHGPLARGQ